MLTNPSSKVQLVLKTQCCQYKNILILLPLQKPHRPTESSTFKKQYIKWTSLQDRTASVFKTQLTEQRTRRGTRSKPLLQWQSKSNMKHQSNDVTMSRLKNGKQICLEIESEQKRQSFIECCVNLSSPHKNSNYNYKSQSQTWWWKYVQHQLQFVQLNSEYWHWATGVHRLYAQIWS